MILSLASRTAAPSSSSSTDPVADDLTATTPGSTNTRTLIIISTVLGTAFFFAIAVAAYFVATRHRKRQAAEDYKNACLRNPDLTWEEYTRRTRLTQSRIILAEEELRDTIIRKSLQARTSITVSTVAPGSPDTEPPVSPPARTRSRIWHGRTRSKSSIEAEEGEGLLMSVRSDWDEHEARVEKTWELLHKKYPTRRVTLPVQEDYGGPVRPPTIRLKTPPLLSHPMFRGWTAEGPVRQSSLPTELARMKPAQI
ncbi:hypothetical protein CGRA01v4_14343 [Colletotrichum graminicola]|uniref:Uncharacterized protein n=1 Tax=Colletotrichum graminicola (strain M1.001 / M2 / FGSC 10212) TaxID=645133 RepID=E3Q5G5_COLGM|nr:uncharacterized protein GLRG_01076 [Colletotrichum graminicola M1.001]EFQ25932.1 hypothetical protein GLRG_01076 [Colletotrichum graminicola M1.001]WDK23052.1 hypothetical protein CGRA01v4_14343 [Colletotrichum graminicola]